MRNILGILLGMSLLLLVCMPSKKHIPEVDVRKMIPVFGTPLISGSFRPYICGHNYFYKDTLRLQTDSAIRHWVGIALADLPAPLYSYYAEYISVYYDTFQNKAGFWVHMALTETLQYPIHDGYAYDAFYAPEGKLIYIEKLDTKMRGLCIE